MLSFHNLSYRYMQKPILGHNPILQNLTDSFPNPGVIGIVGRNGAGKSTLLNILGGLLPQNEGELTLLGKTWKKDEIHLRHQVGLLSENPYLPPYLTVWEFLIWQQKLRSIPGDHGKRANALLDSLQLSDLAQKPCFALSLGQKQRLALAGCLISDPKILLLDEPHNGLDPFQTSRLNELIRLWAKDALVIISSHLLSELTQICSRILKLEHGQLTSLSSSQTIFCECLFPNLSGMTSFLQDLEPQSFRILEKYFPQKDNPQRVCLVLKNEHPGKDLRPLLAAKVGFHGGLLFSLYEKGLYEKGHSHV